MVELFYFLEKDSWRFPNSDMQTLPPHLGSGHLDIKDAQCDKKLMSVKFHIAFGSHIWLLIGTSFALLSHNYCNSWLGANHYIWWRLADFKIGRETAMCELAGPSDCNVTTWTALISNLILLNIVKHSSNMLV